MRKFICLLMVAAQAMFTLLMTGCGDDTCKHSQSSVPKAQLYSSSNLKSITVDSLTVYGVGAPGDSLLVNCGRVSNLKLPLRGNTNITQYVIHYCQKALDDDRNNDTLTFDCEPILFFDSKECGAFYKYNVNGYKYTTHLIDSVSVPDEQFTNNDRVSVMIYMRTE